MSALKIRQCGPPSWQCRCDSCVVAVEHGAPEEDRDYDALRASLLAADERARALAEAARAEAYRDSEEIVRKYLLYDSQRAVSWHEVHDCMNAIRARGQAKADGGGA